MNQQGIDFAKFNARLGKMTLGSKEIKAEIFISRAEFQKNFSFMMDNQEEQIIVHLGDPQMSFNFPEARRDHTGLTAKVDSNGVVESVNTPDDDVYDDQDELEFEDTDDYEELDDEEIDIVEEGYADDADEAIADPQDKEFDFNSDTEPDYAEATQSNESPAALDREAVEEFILKEQPVFEDIEYNFPEILRKKREEGRTWMELANEQGVSSWVFQKEWKKYRERVEKMIGTAS